MNKRLLSLWAFGALALSAFVAQAQTDDKKAEQGFTRPRTVQTPASDETKKSRREASEADVQERTTTVRQETPAPATLSAPPKTIVDRAYDKSQTNSQQPSNAAQQPATVVPSLQTQPNAFAAVPLLPAPTLSVSKARARIQEAERLLKSRSTATASAPSISWVTLAALEHESSQIHLLTLPKETFIKRGAELVMPTNAGLQVRLQIVRPNYVNTAVRISDMAGRQLTPLLVEYPIEKFGQYRETAYYTSAHPALLSPELVKNGHNYVRTMLDLAHKRLKEKGKFISDEIVDIAERLAIVEHVDHQRFRTENRASIYDEIFTLFALNELDTYRYSVSSAGAGGMVQMIPSTYQMLRRLHPTVGLNPDFVLGMRNHGNALEAMLLHMQDNWSALAYRTETQDALRYGWATQTDLVAAGYNSNSAKLPGYIRRGGANWRNLIPRETQMYLQIYKSVESLVKFKNRADDKKEKRPDAFTTSGDAKEN